MADLRKIFGLIPEIKKPDEKKVGFNTKLKWTLIVLGAFFILANIPLFGLSSNALSRFQYLAIILGTDFGSIISLGYWTNSNGVNYTSASYRRGNNKHRHTTDEGKKFFQGIQKLLVFFFIVFEAAIYVLLNGLQPVPGLGYLLIIQLILGGVAIYYMDELTQKWGFGSGVSLFIAAGVSWRLITGAFQFIDQQGRNCLLDFKNVPCSGKVLVLIQSLINRLPTELFSAAAAIYSNSSNIFAYCLGTIAKS